MKRRIYYATQNIAQRIIGESREYSDTVRADLAGEDERGDIVVNVGDDMWRIFKPWHLRDLRAVLRSRRANSINFLELEALNAA